MILDQLLKLGFTEKEGKVYINLLRIGPSPVSSLAQRIGLKRVTVYSVLESLGSRGLVTYEATENGRRYIPLDPDCILLDIERQTTEVRFKMNLARECIDRLNIFLQQSLSPLKRAIVFYRGEVKVKKVLEESLDMNMCKNWSVSNLFSQSSASASVRDIFGEKTLFELKSKSSTEESENLEGVLIIEAPQVYFIFTSEGELQMSVITEQVYAEHLALISS